MKTYELRSPEDIAALTEEWGFLPFFAGEIPGFSVEECCPPELWFSDDADGPWEWKGPVARSGRCVYGKFFGGRAGFISREWLPDFANFRRDGYDIDARYDDGLASRKDKAVYDTVAELPMLTFVQLLKAVEPHHRVRQTGAAELYVAAVVFLPTDRDAPVQVDDGRVIEPYAVAAAVDALAGHGPSRCLNSLRLARKAVFVAPAAYAPRSVSAHLAEAAVGIEEQHPVVPAVLRRCYGHQPICAY